jgi:hypothetical protein
MFHNDVIPFIFERNADVGQESLGRFTHNHGREELAAKPGSASWRDGSLNDGNL